jgi:hypothetical protein
MRGAIPFLTAALLIFSCSTLEVCEEDLLPSAITTFHTYQNGTLTDTILSGIYLYGIRENKPDSLLYDSAKAAKIQLPLNPNSDHSTFVFKVQDLIDTIEIYHTSTIYLLSFTCGFANDFTMTDIAFTRYSLTDIELIKEYVNAEETDVEEHLKFYF